MKKRHLFETRENVKTREKFFSTLLLATMALAFLVSCATSITFEDETEEYDYALHYALNSSNESAISTLYFKVTEASSFIPASLTYIQDNASQIPGMSKLLAEWTAYMNAYSLQRFEDVRTHLNATASAMAFENPIDLVSQSDASASVAYEAAFGAEIKLYLRQELNDVNLSKWEEVAAQYRAWVETRKVLFDEDNVQLEEINILDELAEHISSLYFASLKEAEILLRTTPDPNADKTVSKVFGLE